MNVKGDERARVLVGHHQPVAARVEGEVVEDPQQSFGPGFQGVLQVDGVGKGYSVAIVKIRWLDAPVWISTGTGGNARR